MARFNSRKLIVRFEDAVGVGLTVGPGPGDFTFDDTNFNNSEILSVQDSGAFDCLIQGNDLEQGWSLTLGQAALPLSSAVAALVIDFVNRTGVFTETTGSQATQSVSSNPDIWAFRIIATMTLGATVATATLPHCTSNWNFGAAMEGNTLPLSGTNYQAVQRT